MLIGSTFDLLPFDVFRVDSDSDSESDSELDSDSCCDICDYGIGSGAKSLLFGDCGSDISIRSSTTLSGN